MAFLGDTIAHACGTEGVVRSLAYGERDSLSPCGGQVC
jgi:hypothetical protein